MMKLISKEEWFELDSPIGEPNEKWNLNNKYYIERKVGSDGKCGYIFRYC